MFDIHSVKESVELNPENRVFFSMEKEYQSTPDTHKDQISYLTEEASLWIQKFIGDTGLVNGAYTRKPLVKGLYNTIVKFYYTGDNGPDLKKWLYQRGIAFKKEVFMMDYYSNQAVLLTWKMLVKYSGDIFYGADKVIFDESLNWCLVQYSVDMLHFGRK